MKHIIAGVKSIKISISWVEIASTQQWLFQIILNLDRPIPTKFGNVNQRRATGTSPSLHLWAAVCETALILKYLLIKTLSFSGTDAGSLPACCSWLLSSNTSWLFLLHRAVFSLSHSPSVGVFLPSFLPSLPFPSTSHTTLPHVTPPYSGCPVQPSAAFSK